jgi:endonuclease YncB( thermonuclease family)
VAHGKDQVWGFVREVHDGDTFTLEVTSQLQNNSYPYGARERVRLRGTNAPELGTPGAQAAKRRLGALRGQRVKCTIYSRDNYRRLICEVVRAPSDYGNR